MTKVKVQAYPLLEPYHYLNVNMSPQVLVIAGIVLGVLAGVVACLEAISARDVCRPSLLPRPH